MEKNSFLNNENGTVTGNYANTCEYWRKVFLEMDHEELIRRFHLKQDREALYLTYYHQTYRLDRKTGMITLSDAPEKPLGFHTIISIYNFFYYSKQDAVQSGNFVPFRLVKRAAPFDPAFQKTILKPLAKTFSGHPQLLDRACQKLGGIPVSQGDVGYVISAFAQIPLTILFWDGDEEFEAQANILFDANITDFVHEETVCCIASDLVRRLSEEAELGKVDQLL